MNDDTMFEASVRTLLRESTPPAPPADAWAVIAARVARGDEVLLPDGDARLEPAEQVVGAVLAEPARSGASAVRRGWRPLRVAAIALVAGAAGLAALPGTPLNDWARALFSDGASADSSDGGEPAAPAGSEPEFEPVVPAVARTTLIITPAGGAAVVALVEPGAGVRIRVRFADIDGLEVDAYGGVADARFRSAIGSLTIAEADSGDLVLTIPNRLARLDVTVNGRAYLTKQNGQIRIHSPAADTVGS
jgi:hypothetical protein